MENVYFPRILLKSGIVANVEWREEPGFGMLISHLFVKFTERSFT